MCFALLCGLDDLLVKMPASCLHNRYISCKLSVWFCHCEEGLVGISGSVLLLLLADSLQKKKKKKLNSPPWSNGPQTLMLGIVLCFGKGRGVELSGGLPMPAQAGVQAGAPAHSAASSLPLHTVGAGGRRGKTEVICSHVTFPPSKLCFYNYWPCLPQELWPPQWAVLFHFCQQ